MSRLLPFAALLWTLTFAAPLLTAQDKDGFKAIFDGKTLEGWSGKEKFWAVKDGCITGQTTADNKTDGNTFLIWKDQVGDFELRLKFKIIGGNSGIQYRSTDKGNHVVNGYQADIATEDKYMGILYEEGPRRPRRAGEQGRNHREGGKASGRQDRGLGRHSQGHQKGRLERVRRHR